jgi:hypothetical protein
VLGTSHRGWKRRGRRLDLSAPALVAAVAAFVLPLAQPVVAAGPGDAAAGRYTLAPTEGGFIRLDRETGAMSFCTGKEAEWSCNAMAETESELKKKLDQLEGEKRALEAEKRLRDGLFGSQSPRSGQSGEPPADGENLPPAPPGDLPIPTERDVDKLFDYVEGMVKKFKERIDRLEREAKKGPEIPL